MPQSRLTLAYLIISAASFAGYFALGQGLASVCYLTMSAAAFLAVPIGLRLFKPRDPKPWLILAAGQAAFLIADAIWYAYDYLDPNGASYPSLADGFYLLGYPLLAAGLLLFIRARQPRYRMTAAIDAILIGLAAVLLLWLGIIDGVIHDETIPLLERVVTIAYPTGDALIVAAAAYLLLTGRHGRRSLYLLVASLMAMLGGDVVETVLGVSSAYPAPSDAFWLLSYVLFGLAALDPSMAEIGEPSERPIIAESTGRLVLIGIAIAMLPAFALYQRFFSDHVDIALIGITGVVVISAILLRMHELSAVLGRSERRYASLLANASDAFAVVSVDGRFRYVSPASERVLGYPIKETMSRSALELMHPRGRTRAQAVLRRVGATPGAKEEVEVPVRRADGEWRWLSVTATNRTDDPIVDGIVLNYRDVTEHKRLEERLHRQAFTDALTGLANRPLFIDRLDHVLARRRQEGKSAFSVLFLDVDDFKTVNDSLGHSAGDVLLVTLGERLRATLRPDDTAARLGGDEFAVLLENASEDDARRVASRLLASLGASVPVGDHSVRVTVSIGIAVDAGEADMRADDVLRDADLAMYSAKTTQSGTYAVYEPIMHEQAMRRLEEKAVPDTAGTAERHPTKHWEHLAAPNLKAHGAAT